MIEQTMIEQTMIEQTRTEQTRTEQLKMKKALWFSRHQITQSQVEDAAKRGFDIVISHKGMMLGSMDIKDSSDLKNCVIELVAHCSEVGAEAIFGVFPPPILGLIATTMTNIIETGIQVEPKNARGDFPCYASWNILRAKEGERPTFEHKEWVYIGMLNQSSCRFIR